MDNKEIKYIINTINYILEILKYNETTIKSTDIDNIEIFEKLDYIKSMYIEDKRGTLEFLMLITYIKELINEVQSNNLTEFKTLLKGIKKTLEIRNIIIELKEV